MHRRSQSAPGRSLLALLALAACEAPGPLPERLVGTGMYVFDGFEPLQNKPVPVHYHVPDAADALSSVVLVFHGQNRNADEYRDAWIDKADRYGFVVAAPEFSEVFYPSEQAYNLGNVFVDGDRPSPDGQNEPASWTFTIVEPLFDDLVERTRSVSAVYHLFGHSAGAQFVHRLVQFVPQGRYGYAIAANAGWYTVPSSEVAFPYGLAQSPFQAAGRDFFGHALVVHAGSADTETGDALRQTPEANAQGPHRFARANHFVQESRRLAAAAGERFAWRLVVANGIGHDFVGMTDESADWLAEALDL